MSFGPSVDFFSPFFFFVLFFSFSGQQFYVRRYENCFLKGSMKAFLRLAFQLSNHSFIPLSCSLFIFA